jgi:hypothetical protein
VPQEAPKEAKPEKKGDDPAIDDGSKAETWSISNTSNKTEYLQYGRY